MFSSHLSHLNSTRILCRFVPDVITGDMDSLRPSVMEYYRSKVRFFQHFAGVGGGSWPCPSFSLSVSS